MALMLSRRRVWEIFLSVFPRPCTNPWKLFVFAIGRLRSTSPTLAPLVVLPISMRPIDITLLPLLGSAGQQDDDRLAITPEINPIAWAKIDRKLQHAFSNTFHVGEIALLYPGKRANDLGAGCRVQFREPFGEGLVTARGDVVADIQHTRVVTYALPQCFK